MNTLGLLVLLLAAIATVNVVATVKVCKSTLYETRQKYMQYAFIWLLPLLGAGIALAISAQPEVAERRRRGAGELATGDFEMFGADSGDNYGGGHGHSGGHHG